MKRILSVLLALVMVIGMFPMGILSASAAVEITETITFDADKTQRTSYSTTQQVWGSENVTFTNDKGSSSTDVAGYSNPVRLYQGSTITIATSAGNITKIAITSNGTSKYKTALENSLTGAKLTYTNSGNVYTFELYASSITISLTGQARFQSIAVTYVEASDCAHANTELQGVATAGCVTAGYTGDTYCNDCETVTQYGTSITPTGHTFVDGVCSACSLEQDDITSYALVAADAVEEGTYIICGTKTSENEYPATATISGGDWTVSSTAIIENDGVITADLLPEDAQVFELSGNNTDGFTIGFDNGEEIVYLGYSSYENRTLGWSADYSTVLWSVSAVEAGGVWLVNTTDSGAYNIGQANTTAATALRGYAGGTSIAGIYLFKKVPTAQDLCTHEFGEWTVTEAATCTTKGVQEHTCGLCELVESEYIDELGHTVENGVCSTCKETIYTLATTLADNDKVIIYYAAGELAMTSTASGSKLTGVAGTVTGEHLVYTENMAVLTVEYVDSTNFYLISADGKYLATDVDGGCLVFEETPSLYASWYLTVADEAEGIVYIKNTNAAYETKKQDLEYYYGFTTYNTGTGSAYEMQLYVQAGTATCEHTWSDWTLETDPSCTVLGANVRSCTTEGGCGHTQRSAIAMLGHSYTLSDTAVCSNCEAVLSLSTIETVKSFTDTSTVYYFEGVVTYISGKNVYIEDSTGGVLVYFASAPSDIALGDKIRVCDTMKTYNGLIETPGTTTGEYYVVSSGNDLPCKEVTIATLMADTSNAYLSERVTIKNATVTAISSGSYTLDDGSGSTIKIYKPSGLSSKVVKGVVVDVTAVVSTYNGYQLLVNPGTAATDVVKIENVAVYDGETEVNTYATLEAAYAAAAEGQTIKLLADIGVENSVTVTMDKNVTIDLNGHYMGIVNNGTNAYTVIVKDSALSEEYTLGSFALSGPCNLQSSTGYAVTYDEDEECYFVTKAAVAVSITHISLDAGKDALGFKAQLSGINVGEIAEYGFEFYVEDGRVVTVKKTGAMTKAEMSARISKILELEGGEKVITGRAFVTVNGETYYSDWQSTSMKETIIAVNEMTTLNDTQKANVYALYEGNAETINAWLSETEEGNNIKDWAPTTTDTDSSDAGNTDTGSTEGDSTEAG